MFGTVLCPLDGSREAEVAVPYALDEAMRRECGLVLIRVVPRPEFADIRPSRGGPALTGQPSALAEVRGAEEAALVYLRDVVRRYGLPIEAELVAPVGDPYTRLRAEVGRRSRPLVVLAAEVGGGETARRLFLSGAATVLHVQGERQSAPSDPWSAMGFRPLGTEEASASSASMS
ncbi:MAG: hypothetical protein QOF01_4890 [Thermomicrobiales bacterium]|jgi:nucleotide-binding universal stress UspA family protein|nr:hypothetical protein [Thermomicrobiales bacterium]